MLLVLLLSLILSMMWMLLILLSTVSNMKTESRHESPFDASKVREKEDASFNDYQVLVSKDGKG